MTEQEAIMIAKYVASLCPGQRFNEHTPDTWTDVLAPYEVSEARAAVVTVARRQAFIAPAEIITEIRARRAERIAAANLVYDGDPDETGAESAASIRALNQAAASGLAAPRTVRAALGRDETPALPPGRASAVLASIGREPKAREASANVRTVACRHCDAPPGRSCKSRGGRSRADAHPSRLEDARRAAAGLPPVDPAEAEREIERRIAASQALSGATPTTTFEDVT
ncbi:hypothetical protein OOK29_25820 [Streptomyces phaeochromogenes]|uniref:zinc finger domain-containing protein n=1 Tax=Streptomyces phaeochromogenes TaxID=1923 RepID=UPI00224EE236|nr:hypothetical protein [Streptomyces phaeochromogenes]MCX5601572.1 hypothetical protein [Streptomyces phaeochromogenes]